MTLRYPDYCLGSLTGIDVLNLGGFDVCRLRRVLTAPLRYS